MGPALDVGGLSVSLIALVGLGTSVGLVAGMFGVGGGFLLVPLLHVTLGIPLEFAVGVGLCQTIATALGSFLRYRRMGHAESRFDMMLLGGSLLGVYAGAMLLEALSAMEPVVLLGRTFPAHRILVTVLYLLLFFVMAWLLWSKAGEPSRGTGPFARVPLPPRTSLPVAGVHGVSGPFIGYVGLLNGLLAGLLGIGGGICLIPIMLYGFGFDIKKVAGTGIIVVLLVAVVGTVKHASLGNVHLGMAMTLMVGAALAAQVGASLTRKLSRRVLSRGLAVVMLVTNVALVFKLLAT